MRKIFMDLEFIEDGRTIDIISIALIDEHGKTYYAVNRDCDFSKASDWVKTHVLKFIHPEGHDDTKWRTKAEIAQDILEFVGNDTPEFWGYFSDYDWVAFCQLYGTMMDLPSGWPFFCRDLKQLAIMVGADLMRDFPQQVLEHHALADARWIADAYKWIRNNYEVRIYHNGHQIRTWTNEVQGDSTWVSG